MDSSVTGVKMDSMSSPRRVASKSYRSLWNWNKTRRPFSFTHYFSLLFLNSRSDLYYCLRSICPPELFIQYALFKSAFKYLLEFHTISFMLMHFHRLTHEKRILAYHFYVSVFYLSICVLKVFGSHWGNNYES